MASPLAGCPHELLGWPPAGAHTAPCKQRRSDGEGVGSGSIAGLGRVGSQGCAVTGGGWWRRQPSLKRRPSLVLRRSINISCVGENTGDIAWGRLDRRAWQASWRGRCISLEESCGISLYVCPAQDPSGHQAVLGMAFFTLALFVTLYVLVYMECLVRRWLRTLALVIWVCLMMLGYTLVLDSWMKAAPTWAQVTGWGTLATPRGWMSPASCAPGSSCPCWNSGSLSPSGDRACFGCTGLGPTSAYGPWLCNRGRALG